MQPTHAKLFQRQFSYRQLPPGVIRVFNKLLEERFCNNNCIIYEDTIIRNIMEDMNIDKRDIISNNWLHIAAIVYRKAGWEVERKIGYDGYEHFIFSMTVEKNEDNDS